MFKSFLKKRRLAKLDKRKWADIHLAYAMNDKGNVVTVIIDFELLNGQSKTQTNVRKGRWREAWDSIWYTTAMELAEGFVECYCLPKKEDVEFDDGTFAPYSSILTYTIRIV